jgi:hypothetical protein
MGGKGSAVGQDLKEKQIPRCAWDDKGEAPPTINPLMKRSADSRVRSGSLIGESHMTDKGGAFNKQGQNMQRQQGKFNKLGQNQQDQDGHQRQKGQEKWPVDELSTDS